MGPEELGGTFYLYSIPVWEPRQMLVVESDKVSLYPELELEVGTG